MIYTVEKTVYINGITIYNIKYDYINGLLKVYNNTFEFIPINAVENDCDTNELYLQGHIVDGAIRDGPKLLVKAINAAIQL